MLDRRRLLQSTILAAAWTALPRLAYAAAPAATGKEAPLLLRPWTGPLDSPPFDKVKLAELEPAMQAGFAANKLEVEAIARQATAANFENTVAALERSGRGLSRASSVFNALSGTVSDKKLQAVETHLSPKFAAHADTIALTPGLYPRVAAVFAGAGDLSVEQRRVAERYEIQFVRRGAKLSRTAKTRMRAINQRLASLQTNFSQNLLKDEEDFRLVLNSEAELAGLPDAVRAGAAAAAAEKGLKGKWLIANTRSSMEPFLTYADLRDLRERGFRMWSSRGDNANPQNNKKLITEILALRTERAQLLGYKTHADFQLADTMAKVPQAGLDLIQAVWKPAVKAALADRDSFQAMVDEQAAKGGEKFKLQPWDWRYYAEKQRKAKYDIDESEVKPYLQLAKIREATFWCAEKLYGVRFEPRTDVAVYHPDVKVWTMKGGDGKPLALFYFDPYARAGKRSGAWMSEYRVEEKFDGVQLPLVVNVCNFVKPAAGEPALLSIDDLVTTFHEFGHALHGLLTQANYPTVSGTNVPRDFVEFPSQVNEHWALRPEVLERFAVHYKTGEAMPKVLIERIQKARTFNQGFATVEFLASAWVDMDVHLSTDKNIDIGLFEKASLAKLGMPDEIVMRHRPTQFGHIFASDDYSAGYYAYLWAQVLDNDGFAAFEEAGDVFSPVVAQKLRDEVLARGNTRDPAESYRAFRGRDPNIDALLRNRGFTSP